MLIRTFQDADAAAVAALWGEVFAGERPHNDAPRIFAEKREVQPELFFVAELDGAVVGTVLAGYDGHRGWLYRVAVNPRVQRSGIGTALVRHAEAALIALGCPKVNLQVRSRNAAVIAFYRKLGWEVEELISLGKLLPRREIRG
jgi:ribosomal protein S18 acetylase RimI-like enzyme